MRIIFVLLSISIFFSCGKKINNTQTKIAIYEEEIKSKLNLYLGKVVDGDYEGMMDILYPKLFEIASREQLLEVFKSVFEGEEMKITFANREILKVYDNMVEMEDRLHALVDYNVEMSMSLKGAMIESELEMLLDMEEDFGKENVTYDKDEHTFVIKMKNQMIAIKENDKWYFLENKKEQIPILKSILGSEILSKLGIDLE
jgi:hypothetical protein